MIADNKIVTMNDGTKIYAEITERDKDVWLIATHGIGEHLGRHKYLVDLFADKYNIFQYDLRGHGKSSGPRADVQTFNSFMEDLSELIVYLQSHYKMKKYVLFGHSMGALITCSFMQRFVEEDMYPEKVVVNAPPVGLDGILGDIVNCIPQTAVGFLGKLPVSFPIKGMIDLSLLSHDPAIAELYRNDPLCSMVLRSRLLIELVHESKKTFSRPIRSKCHSYVSIGTADRVVGVKPLIEYFTNMDKSFGLKTFEGSYHEIHNELDKYRKPYFDYLKSIL